MAKHHARVRTSKWTAIRWTLEGLLVVVLIILAVSRYEQHLLAINWKLVSFACIAAAGAFALYRYQMQPGNKFDLFDTVRTDEGKADSDKIFKWVFAGLSFWVVVQMVLTDKDPTALLTIVLGTFVAKSAADKFTDALSKRGPPVDKSQDINILPDAKIQASAPKKIRP
jgi:hypothetical protein